MKQNPYDDPECDEDFDEWGEDYERDSAPTIMIFLSLIVMFGNI